MHNSCSVAKRMVASVCSIRCHLSTAFHISWHTFATESAMIMILLPIGSLKSALFIEEVLRGCCFHRLNHTSLSRDDNT